MYYKHQVDGTRPNPNNGKHAVVSVKELESGEDFRIDTEHVVLNVPNEVSFAAMRTTFLATAFAIQSTWEGVCEVERGTLLRS